ncbi:MAG: DUF2157 domain-containing protein [Microcystaceae cyanobacterium]
MNLEPEDFHWAAHQGLISEEQAEQLWQAFAEKYSTQASNKMNQVQFDVANVAYYFGALIVMTAMGFFMSLAWEALGGFGIMAIALLYGLGFILGGQYLYFQQNLKIPGGLLFTLAVWMTPVAIYGWQRGTGFWVESYPENNRSLWMWLQSSWMLMDLGTILASLIALRFVKFPFLTFPLALGLWHLSVDIIPYFYTGDNAFRTRATISLWYGLLCSGIAYWVDLRCRRSEGDYAFWLYLFGVLTFWVSLPLTGEDTEWHRFLYFLINLGLMMLSLLLKRRLLMVFGGLGVFGYISYLAFQVFTDSLLFPLILSALGLLIIYLGILYQRHYHQLEQTLTALLPESWRSLLPRER